MAGWTGIGVVALVAASCLWSQAHQFFSSSATAAERASRPTVCVDRDRRRRRPNPKPAVPTAELPAIKVGIVHSLSGPMAASERPVVDAWLFAIDEINQAGGLLGGRTIEPMVRDGKSYDDVFAQQAERPDRRRACRHAVRLLAIVVPQERGGSLPQASTICWFIRLPTKGWKNRPYVIYMGGAPNQQILPSVKWAFAFLGKRKFFLIGTDGVYSRCTHEIMQDEVAELGGKIVGNEYRMLGDNEFTPIAAEVLKSGADVVVNTVVGTGNIALFSALRKAGIRPDKIPVISMNVTEEELRTLSASGRELAGDYAAWSYFQSLPNQAQPGFPGAVPQALWTDARGQRPDGGGLCRHASVGQGRRDGATAIESPTSAPPSSSSRPIRPRAW